MENRHSLIEQHVLSILEQIEYFFDTARPDYLEKCAKQGCYPISFGDINFGVLSKPENLYGVAKYLKENNIPFEIAFDLVNEHPEQSISDDCPTVDMVTLAYIDGNNTKVIKNKIVALKQKIIGPDRNRENKSYKFSFNANSGTLEVGNAKITLSRETLERVLLEVLIESKESETSWDIIMCQFEGNEDYPCGGDRGTKAIKQVGDARSRLNSKISRHTPFKEGLIARRENNYSLTQKVTEK